MLAYGLKSVVKSLPLSNTLLTIFSQQEIPRYCYMSVKAYASLTLMQKLNACG